MVNSVVIDSKGQVPRSDDSNGGATARATMEAQQPTTNRKKQKAGHRAKHRLRSIYRDVRAMENLKRNHTHDNHDDDNNNKSLATHALQHWKWIPNERCGSWYIPQCNNNNNNNSSSNTSCYFKSTDGHVNFWDFSLKRLNLGLLESIVVDGGCVLIDSSVRKLLPDSFSKTIPIWTAVLNRFVGNYKDEDDKRWNNDTTLHTPKGIVSHPEHDKIVNLMPERVQTLIRSGAIVNPDKLVERFTKPLRVVWMDHGGEIYASNGDEKDVENTADLLQKYFVIVCWNPSRYQRKPTTDDAIQKNSLIALKKHQTEWIAEDDKNTGYYYTPGAADDHESWAKHLTPTLFWRNQETLLDPTLDDEQVDALIDVLVEEERKAQEALEQQRNSGEGSFNKATETVYSYSDRIGETDLWIGSRRASRPPECWSGFDAILNVTNQEYDGMMEDDNSAESSSKFYLQLVVEEGKRDRTQLEKYMPVGLAFLIHHLQRKRRVLVHCAQGKDRSVAVALVLVVMVCPLRFPLRYKPEFLHQTWDFATLQNCGTGDDDSKNRVGGDDAETKETPERRFYRSSGLPDGIVQRLLDEGGRERFLLWIHQQLEDESNGSKDPLADKEGVRIALHLIKQDREVAEPTRATMQKINRFLMSSSIYR